MMKHIPHVTKRLETMLKQICIMIYAIIALSAEYFQPH